MCNRIPYLSLLILPTPWTLCTVKLQLSIALILLWQINTQKNLQLQEIQERNNSSPESENTKKDGLQKKKRMCDIISNAKYLFITQVSISYFRRLINIFTHKFSRQQNVSFFHCGEQQK